MNFQDSILLDAPPNLVWKLLDDPEAVSRCIPGLDGFEAVDSDNFTARISQTVGPVTAVFAMKLSVVEREPGKALRFSASGKTSSGAVSHLRAKGSVELDEDADGTRLTLKAGAALGGVLGTVGEKVLVKQSEKITAQFADALRRELAGKGSGSAVSSPDEHETIAATSASATQQARSGLVIHTPSSPLAALLVGLALGLVIGRASKRARRAP